MTKEEIIDGLEIYTVGRLNNSMVHITIEELQNFIDAIKTLEQDTCEDCISRQEVLEIAKSSKSNWIDNSVLFNKVCELPSVTPAEKIGQWVFNDTVNEHAHCSECGYGNVDLVNGKTHNYCECCGAKMEMPENRMSREDAIRYCEEYLATNNVSNIDKEFLRTAKEALQKEVKVDE